VVENISKMFGVDPFYYYIHELKYFLTADQKLFELMIFGMCLFTFYQVHGLLPLNDQKT